MDAFPEPAEGTDAEHGLRKAAHDVQWLLDNLVEDVPGVRSAAVVSSDGLPLLASASGPQAEAGRVARDGADGPERPGADLATVVSGLGSLTIGAAGLLRGGRVKQTMIAMDQGSLMVMSVSDGSVLGVHATADCDMSLAAYHLTLFVRRVGHALTPELRKELHRSMQKDG